ncbi:MAG: thiamine pyrophosphate-binding protein [SAR324 cluster bacterium]|nr:thiamine pyrophosphate-binding protein [SAR324 cluster bacterium]
MKLLKHMELEGSVHKNTQFWAEAIHASLKFHGIRQVSYVPDAGHSRLIDLCRNDEELTTVVLTTEEEGVAMATGAWLGGEKSVLLMQSSGIGNCINMFSMIRECKIPFFTVITMRGEKDEFNPWQRPLGQNAEKHLELCGFSVRRIEKSEETRTIMDNVAEQVFETSSMGAVLISQQMIGIKSFAHE